jgi:hypothetical protein
MLGKCACTWAWQGACKADLTGIHADLTGVHAISGSCVEFSDIISDIQILTSGNYVEHPDTASNIRILRR